MKQIRILAIFSFVIFFCPFFQMCSDKKIIDEPLMKGSPIPKIVSREETNEDRKQIVYGFLEARENMTLNGYEIGLKYFSDFSAMQLFIIPIILNILTLFFALKDKIKSIFYTSLSNIIFCLAWLLLAFLSNYLEDTKQVKFGFYLFLINLSFICYLTKLHTTAATKNHGSYLA